ncbi:MAG: hypothetical protein Q9227_003826 [Pyrenula ochraceoflavens]
MVDLNIVRSRNAQLLQSRQPFVAVFVGGTAGIGEYSVRSLAFNYAKYGTDKGLRVYVVGRNANAAEKILSDCREICPSGNFRFVKAENLSLLRDVDRVCAEIIDHEKHREDGTGRVDFLVETQGYLSFSGREETPEGLDALMSLLYYSRMRFIIQLLPLLLASPTGHVVSVLNPRLDRGRLVPEDLSLRDPKNFGFSTGGAHIVCMTTFFFEELAKRYRLSLIHEYPGLVMTNATETGKLPTWVKLLWRIIAPVLSRFAITPSDCGDRHLFLATSMFPARDSNEESADALGVATSSDSVSGGGAYRVNWDGGNIPATDKVYKKPRTEGVPDKVWKHTMEVFEQIEDSGVFKGQ